MHAALRTLQADAAPAPAVVPARTGIVSGLRAGSVAAVVLILVVALWSLQGPAPSRIEPLADATVLAPVAIEPVVAAVAATPPETLPTVDASEAMHFSSRMEPPTTIAAVPNTEPVAVMEPVAVEPMPTPAGTPAIHVAESAPPSEGIDAQAVARVVANFEQAMRIGDLDRGKAHLDDLASLLPARSLTLQRMQAWHAHQSGDTATAIALYGEIVQRIPNDPNAVINLALLEAAQGDVDGASQRLRTLRSMGGESTELAAAMAVVGAKPR